MVKKIIFSVCFLFLYCLTDLSAQTVYNSPFSRLGLGDPLYGKAMKTSAMGNVSIAYRDPQTVNYTNPASYTVFDSLSFVFETGLYGRLTRLSTSNAMQDNQDVQLGQLVFGFPIARNFGGSFGLVPVFDKSYQLSETGFDAQAGDVRRTYSGSGSLNQIYLGFGWELYKGLSLGVNGAYLFGNLYEQKQLDFLDQSDYLNVEVSDVLKISDFKFDLGVQYEKAFDAQRSLIVGATYFLGDHINATNTVYTSRYREYTSGSSGVNVKDTIGRELVNDGVLTLPSGIAGGVVFQKNNHWLVGLDVRAANWSDYKEFGRNDSLSNDFYAGLGMQWIPNHKSLKGYYNRVAYRLGGYYNNTYVKGNNAEIAEYGITFGLGLPVRNRAVRPSYVNLSVELGRRGDMTNTVLQEEFVRFTVGFSLYEHWFLKRRYD